MCHIYMRSSHCCKNINICPFYKCLLYGCLWFNTFPTLKSSYHSGKFTSPHFSGEPCIANKGRKNKDYTTRYWRFLKCTTENVILIIHLIDFSGYVLQAGAYKHSNCISFLIVHLLSDILVISNIMNNDKYVQKCESNSTRTSDSIFENLVVHQW